MGQVPCGKKGRTPDEARQPDPSAAPQEEPRRRRRKRDGTVLARRLLGGESGSHASRETDHAEGSETDSSRQSGEESSSSAGSFNLQAMLTNNSDDPPRSPRAAGAAAPGAAAEAAPEPAPEAQGPSNEAMLHAARMGVPLAAAETFGDRGKAPERQERKSLTGPPPIVYANGEVKLPPERPAPTGAQRSPGAFMGDVFSGWAAADGTGAAPPIVARPSPSPSPPLRPHEGVDAGNLVGAKVIAEGAAPAPKRKAGPLTAPRLVARPPR